MRECAADGNVIVTYMVTSTAVLDFAPDFRPQVVVESDSSMKYHEESNDHVSTTRHTAAKRFRNLKW